jgi:hypothetical protein
MNCCLKIKESANKKELKRKEELEEILPLFEGKLVGEDYRSWGRLTEPVLSSILYIRTNTPPGIIQVGYSFISAHGIFHAVQITFPSNSLFPSSLLTPIPVDGYFGLTLLEALDAFPVPTPFVAVTVNVYEVPLVSPGTTIEVEFAVTWIPPGFEVTVYDMMGLPLFAAAAKATVAWALPAVAVGLPGAPGTPTIMTGLDAPDGKLEPAEVIAVTVNVYWVPILSPVMVIEVEFLVTFFPSGLEVTV